MSQSFLLFVWYLEALLWQHVQRWSREPLLAQGEVQVQDHRSQHQLSGLEACLASAKTVTFAGEVDDLLC